MAETSSDAFLSGEGIPVDLHDIETELVRLWGPAAERAGGPDLESPHVTRVVLANLVVEGGDASAAGLKQVLDAVTAQYPCRTIVLRRTEDSARAIAAEVSALCYIPAPGLPQVCSERIVLRGGPQATTLLPGAVRPLLEADLPFVLWWTDDPRHDEPLFRNLADECSRLILDLPDPGTDPAALRLGLDPKINPYSRDTAWLGLTRWRELVAQFFDPPCHHENLARIDSLRIEALAPSREAPPRLALWMAAWMAGQLGWQPLGRPERSPGRLGARFRGPSGEIAVEIVTELDSTAPLARLRAVTLTTQGPEGAESFRLERPAPQSAEVHIKIHSSAYCNLPRVVRSPELDPARRVAAGLQASREDPTFVHALPHLFWMMEG
jgi:glucose-6-phosphate dehydrogenase assembly protein OpcA